LHGSVHYEQHWEISGFPSGEHSRRTYAGSDSVKCWQ